MSYRPSLLGAFAALLVVATPLPAATQAAPTGMARDAALEAKNLAIVLEFQEKVFNQHDMRVADRLLTDNYIQHNPRIPNGKAAFISFFSKLGVMQPTRHSDIIRSAVNGDLVFVHIHSSDGTGKGDAAIVNIYRIENGKIAEHWDVVQPVPEGASVNGNTMF